MEKFISQPIFPKKIAGRINYIIYNSTNYQSMANYFIEYLESF